MTEGPDQDRLVRLATITDPAGLTKTIRDYVAEVAKPYSARHQLNIPTRLVVLLDYWLPRLPHLGLVELQQEAEWQIQLAAAVLKGNPLAPKPDNLSATPASAPASLEPAPPSVPAPVSPEPTLPPVTAAAATSGTAAVPAAPTSPGPARSPVPSEPPASEHAATLPRPELSRSHGNGVPGGTVSGFSGPSLWVLFP